MLFMVKNICSKILKMYKKRMNSGWGVLWGMKEGI